MFRALALLFIIVVLYIVRTPVLGYRLPSVEAFDLPMSSITDTAIVVFTRFSQLVPLRNPKDYLPEISDNLSDSVKGVLSGNIGMMAEFIEDQIPLVSEAITNTQKEELYLRAPVSLELPALRVESYSQKIVSQLDPFEVSDTRKNGKDWELRIAVDELTNDKSRIEKEGITLQLRSDAIEMFEGTRNELEITEGPTLIIKPKSGKNRVKFLVRPEITVVIPKGIYSGHYTGKINSTLE